MANLAFRAQSACALSGTLSIPGDKSISHRALILSSLAEGVSYIQGLLVCEDTLALIRVLRALGVIVQKNEGDVYSVYGVGLHGLTQPNAELDFGNSGTAFRLMAGILAAQSFTSTLVGDTSLSSRPMNRIVKPLVAMGADITGENAPLKIQPISTLKSVQHVVSVASAQVISCLLFAGLYVDGQTSVTNHLNARDHTLRLLETFCYPVTASREIISVVGNHVLQPAKIKVPSDLSSAAFFIIAALIVPGSHIILPHIGVNPTRSGILTLLKKMGASISITNYQTFNNEPVADIEVCYSELRGIEISSSFVANTIDDFPALFIAAAVAQGMTTLRGASELRVKECDRLAAMVAGLRENGIAVTEYDDGLTINGGELRGGAVASCGDHRIAMAFIIAGMIAKQPIEVDNVAMIDTSFPSFLEKVNQFVQKEA